MSASRESSGATGRAGAREVERWRVDLRIYLLRLVPLSPGDAIAWVLRMEAIVLAGAGENMRTARIQLIRRRYDLELGLTTEQDTRDLMHEIAFVEGLMVPGPPYV